MKKLILIVSLAIFTISTAFCPANRKKTGDEVFQDILRMREFRQEMIRQMEITLEVTRLLWTIYSVESSGRYHVRGGSLEYGKYQFQPGTWDMWCLKLYGEILDIHIPEEQDRVAEGKVRYLLQQGLTTEEIAAYWNSGSERNWQKKKGINRWGRKYDVPAYVQKFIKIYNSYERS